MARSASIVNLLWDNAAIVYQLAPMGCFQSVSGQHEAIATLELHFWFCNVLPDLDVSALPESIH